MWVTVTSLLGAVCHQFESDPARQGPVAQLVAQRQKVRAAFLCFLYQSDSACVGYFNQELLILTIESTKPSQFFFACQFMRQCIGRILRLQNDYWFESNHVHLVRDAYWVGHFPTKRFSA